MNTANRDFVNVLDEAVTPRVLQRNVPTQRPTFRFRIMRRPMFHAAFAGQTISPGTILPLTLEEVGVALYENWGELLDPIPQPGNQFYGS